MPGFHEVVRKSTPDITGSEYSNFNGTHIKMDALPMTRSGRQRRDLRPGRFDGLIAEIAPRHIFSPDERDVGNA